MIIRCSVLVAALMAVGTGDAATIYRCADGRGGVLYVDSPCTNGVVVDAPSGKADAAAIERLRRDIEEFDRRHARREASDAAAREQARLAAERYRSEEEALRREQERRDASTYAYPYYFGYPYFGVPNRPVPRKRIDVPERPLRRPAFVPAR